MVGFWDCGKFDTDHIVASYAGSTSGVYRTDGNGGDAMSASDNKFHWSSARAEKHAQAVYTNLGSYVHYWWF